MYHLIVAGLVLSLACAGPLPFPKVPAGPPVAAPAAPAVPAAPTSVAVPRVRPVFPLVVGDRWVWRVTRDVGAGPRVLFIPTEAATHDVVATWTLTIDHALPEGRFSASILRATPGALPATTSLTLWTQQGDLWMEGPVGPQLGLELTVPPGAVATERVPCVAHFLDRLPGVCSPAPGGPLQVPPGPTFGLVRSDADRGRTAAQVLVGLGTAGLFIPGNRGASEYAELVSWNTSVPAARSPVVEQYRKDPTIPLPAALDREEAAAILALAEHADRMALAVFPTVAVQDRPPLVRVVLDAEDYVDARLPTLAALLLPLGGVMAPEFVDSVVVCVTEADQAGARALLEGRWQVLRAMLLDPSDATLRAAVAAAPPDADEAAAILKRADSPGSALDVLLPSLPRAGRLALVQQASSYQDFDGDRLTLLDGRDELFSATTDAAGIVALLDTYTFDAGRAAAADRILAATPADRRAPVVVGAIVGMDHDDGRMLVVDRWLSDVRALGAADQELVLASFVFDRPAAEARVRQ